MGAPGGQTIVHFNIPEVVEASRRATGRAANQVAEEIELYIQEHSDSPAPPPSLPGQYPHKRSGNFAAGVRVTGTANGFTVYSRMPYGRYLEEGTENMDPRPWAYRALVARNWMAKVAKLAREFTGGERRRSK